jgi:U3 small nucleolar RNA-associated protein 7
MDKNFKKERDTERLNKKLNKISNQNTKYLSQEQEGYIQADEGEETNKFSQEFMKDYIPNYNAQNIFDLKLPKGPFQVDFSTTGKDLLLMNRNSASVLDWKSKDPFSEVNLDEEEKIFNGCFINNNNMFCLSQTETLNFYDKQGIEIHSLSQFSKPKFLQNLPYHYLLAWSTKNK